MHSLKYLGWSALARGMAPYMVRLSWPPDVVAERSVVVPVPLTPERRRERGYNQSALLAGELAKFWRVPMREFLTRIRSTQSQTQLTPGERLHNVAGAFTTSVPKSALVHQHIILVDDVVTTAATLNSCATALYENGARIISYVTFGRARAAGDRL